MKKTLLTYLILLILAAGCDDNKKIDNETTAVDKFIGERIDGPANIRDSINGNLIFELLDDVEVEATDFENKWCEIGLFVKLSKEQYENEGHIEKGADLINSDGKIIGKTLSKVITWTDVDGKEGYFGYIAGKTHQNNIKRESLIEVDLTNYMKSHSRERSEFNDFIHRHNLQEENRFLDFNGYYIYENWITDPSPGERICLLFKNDKLQGVLHTRDLVFPNSKKIKLVNGFNVTFFKDYPESEQKKYIDYMKEWLSGVD